MCSHETNLAWNIFWRWWNIFQSLTHHASELCGGSKIDVNQEILYLASAFPFDDEQQERNTVF